jgi:hypothetical protein
VTVLPSPSRAERAWSINPLPSNKDQPLAKPNYQFEKRQKEIEKKKKKEKKSQRKQDKDTTLPKKDEG